VKVRALSNWVKHSVLCKNQLIPGQHGLC
jgi:hypothetical protein